MICPFLPIPWFAGSEATCCAHKGHIAVFLEEFQAHVALEAGVPLLKRFHTKMDVQFWHSGWQAVAMEGTGHLVNWLLHQSGTVYCLASKS